MSRRIAARPVLLALALIDLLVFGGWIAREEVARRTGTEVLLPVEGFDPRDLLSGHYVRFRLLAEREARNVDPSAGGADVEYCLERGAEGRAHVARRRDAGDLCPLFITTVRSVGVSFGVNRFYVDERRAGEALGLTADDAHLVAHVDGRGHIHPVDLVVRGKSLRGR